MLSESADLFQASFALPPSPRRPWRRPVARGSLGPKLRQEGSMEAPEVARLLDFSGRVVAVTGAGSGLGQGVARRFAAAGAHVVVHYRRAAAGATALVDAIGRDRAVAVEADLT